MPMATFDWQVAASYSRFLVTLGYVEPLFELQAIKVGQKHNPNKKNTMG